MKKDQHQKGNLAVITLQEDADINTEEDSRPVDKTAVMTSVEKKHHHHAKPTDKAAVQKSSENIVASKKSSDVKEAKKAVEVKATAEVKQQTCPTCKECSACQCAAQSVSPLEELATHSNELSF